MEEDGIKHARAGFTFKNLNVSGTGAELQLQSTVASLLMAPFRFRDAFNLGHMPEKQILRNFNGTVKDGEMLIVLGKPGSGCTTFLKSISGEIRGLNVHKDSVIHYNGIPQHIYKKSFVETSPIIAKPMCTFPISLLDRRLTSPRPHERHRPENTKVGNDFVRGVSGGERKRVSIAEMAVSGSPICCWDNSTRGLDAATALEFIQALRIASNVGGITQAVAIYQASQAIYDIFDKAIVLYEGRQIYFGCANSAKDFFTSMGYYCPARQTTGDFLTSITNPSERQTREGFE
ncbi:P-loop containing nucleoside triphosphate hydrolase protein [Lipomyces mesembrius]